MLMKGDFSSMKLMISDWEYRITKNGVIGKQALSAFRLVYEEMIFRVAAEYSFNISELISQEIFHTPPEPLSDYFSFHEYLHLLATELYEKYRNSLPPFLRSIR